MRYKDLSQGSPIIASIFFARLMDTLINSYAVSIIYLQYQQIILLHAYTYASVCTNYKLPQATLNGFSLGVLSILDPIMPHKRDTLYYFFGTQSILKTFSKLEKDVDTMKLVTNSMSISGKDKFRHIILSLMLRLPVVCCSSYPYMF